MTFTLDTDGGAEVLQVMSASVIAELGAAFGAAAGDEATVKTFVTDRAKATVSVPAELQARDGVLTRAASAAGMELEPLPEQRKRPPRKPRKPPTHTADGVAI